MIMTRLPGNDTCKKGGDKSMTSLGSISDDSERIKEEVSKFIDECIRGAYSRMLNMDNYDPKIDKMDWVVIENSSGDKHLYIVKSHCRDLDAEYEARMEIKDRVEPKLGIIFGNKYGFCCLFDSSCVINPNHTRYKLGIGKWSVCMNVIDREDEDSLSFDEGGRHIYPRRLEALFKESFGMLQEDDGLSYMDIPAVMNKDWGMFKKLYMRVFGEDVGKYRIVCSDGIEVL